MLIRIFVAWIVLAGVLGFFVGASLLSEPSDCFQYGKAQSGQHAHHTEDAAPGAPGSGHHNETSDKAAKPEHDCKPWWGPEWFLVWVTIGVVLITSALAVYTGLLWRSTRDLVADAKQTSRTQLRAYVHPDSLNLWDGNTLNPPQPNRAFIPGIVMQWRNTGQTPARDVVSWARVAVFSPRNEHRYVPPPKLIRHFSNNLGRNIAGTKSLWYRRALTPQQQLDIQSGRLGIYLYGRIEYRDVFGRDHWTNFKYVYINSVFPPVAPGGGTLNICQHGNKTDED